MIANTLEPSASPKRLSRSTRQRALSFARTFSDSSLSSHGSDDSSCEELSSSPVGFWYVPPSASKKALDDDEEDQDWSPFASPAQSPTMTPIGADLERQRTVKFDMGSLIHSLTSTKSPDVLSSTEAYEKPVSLLSGLGFRRSQSYSAFSFKRIMDDEESRTMVKDSSDQQRHYFYKFIDLLVYREISQRLQTCSSVKIS